MTSINTNEPGTLLDFPGADALRAAGAVEAPSPAALARTQAAVRAAIEAADAPTSTMSPVTPLLRTPRGLRPLLPRGRPRVLLTAVAAGVAAAVTAGVLVASGPGGGERPSAAAVFLDHAADAAAATSVSKAPYWEASYRYRDSGTFGKRDISEQIYYNVKNGDVYDHTAKGWTFTSGRSLARKYREAVAERKKMAARDRARGVAPDTDNEYVITTPVNPANVLRGLRENDPKVAGSTFSSAFQVLASQRTTPAQRAAIYRGLGRLPGVRLGGPAKDHAGRTGVAVQADDDRGLSFRMIIDPHSYALLEGQSFSSPNCRLSCRHPAKPQLAGYWTSLYNGPSEGPTNLPAHIPTTGK
jgi:hypothetical protein